MKIIRLDIQNFMAIGAAEVALDDRGLVLIQGENRDDPSATSNGAGKSTVVEALCWALYGKTAKGVSGDEVVNNKTGAGTRVSVTLDDGGETYVVRRHRKHKTGKNRLEVVGVKGGVETDYTRGTDKLTQDLVERIMGCPHEVFVAAIYAGQEAMPDLPAMTDKQLKLLIEEAAGVTTLERAYEIARRKSGEAVTDLERAEHVAERRATAVETASDRVRDAEHAHRMWESDRKTRLRDLVDEAKTLIEEARAAQAWIDANPAGDLDARIAKIDASLAGLKGEAEERDRLESEAASLGARAARARSEAERAVRDATEAKQDVERLRSGIGMPCAKCGRPHDADSLKDAIAGAEKAAAASDAKAREMIDAARVARTLAESSAERVEAFKRSMTDASKESAERASLATQRDAIQRRALDRDRAAAAARKRKEALDAEKAKTNPHDAIIEERRREHADAIRARDEALAAVKGVAKRAATLKTVAEVFGPKGVRAHILDNVTPFLNARTATYLGALSDGSIQAVWQTLTRNGKGELREKFNIEVAKRDGARSFAALSGGEKRKVRIATALALQDLVASRAAKPIDLWVGDEIDAALDAAGLERLMNVLQDKARERGTVLVISHTDLRDWINQTMTVVKQNEMATVK